MAKNRSVTTKGRTTPTGARSSESGAPLLISLANGTFCYLVTGDGVTKHLRVDSDAFFDAVSNATPRVKERLAGEIAELAASKPSTNWPRVHATLVKRGVFEVAEAA